MPLGWAIRHGGPSPCSHAGRVPCLSLRVQCACGGHALLTGGNAFLASQLAPDGLSNGDDQGDAEDAGPEDKCPKPRGIILSLGPLSFGVVLAAQRPDRPVLSDRQKRRSCNNQAENKEKYGPFSQHCLSPLRKAIA